MELRSALNLLSDSLHALPIAILYITDKCNSRCISCDYWRHGQREMSMELASSLARELSRFGTHYVLLSGGEPLQHSRWTNIAATMKENGFRVAMATSGLLLARHADAVSSSVDELFVSLDGATPELYQSIRGVDGFDLVRQGIEALAGKLPITIRTTVQRANYKEMPALIRLTRSWGANHHSFLAVDVSNHAAFARKKEFDSSMALAPEDLDPFAQVLEEIEDEFGADFSGGYLLEPMSKLRRLYQYFAALQGQGEFPPVHCNAPRFSAVIETDGSVKPCFFLPASAQVNGTRLSELFNTPAAKAMRQQQKLGNRPECTRCVCPAYKGPRELLEGL